MAITFNSPKMKGLKVKGSNINLKGETVPWDGIATGQTQVFNGRKDYLIMSHGPHWLNRATFTESIGTWEYQNGKHVGYTTDVPRPIAKSVVQAPKAQVNNGICTVNGRTYVLRGRQWVPANSQLLNWLKQTLINA